MRNTILASVALSLALPGCARKSDPLLSHGKTVAEWSEALKHADPKVRKKAVVALGHAAAAEPAALTALTGALSDPDAAVRDKAVLALLNLGPAARSALPALEMACNDAAPAVKAHAAQAVAALQAAR